MENVISKVFEPARLRLSRQITPAQYLSDFLSTMCLMADQSIGDQRCALFLLDTKKPQLILKTQNGLTSRFQTVSPLLCESSIEGRAITGRKPLYVSDLSNDPDCSYRKEAQALSLSGLVCIPLKAGSKILGVVNFYTSASPETVSSSIEPMTRIVYKAAAKINDMALLGIA